MGKNSKHEPGCLCGSNDSYANCCGRYVDGSENAPSPETLMRSRYCAYTLGNSNYLLSTWHASTRPSVLALEKEITRWSGLTIVSAEPVAAGAFEGEVEFIARYKINGKAGKLQECSRFIKESGCWFYVEGEIMN